MKVAILLMMFLFIGMFFIISENKLALGEKGNFDRFVGLYASWFSHIFDNSKSVVGYVVKMEWLPENKTSTE